MHSLCTLYRMMLNTILSLVILKQVIEGIIGSEMGFKRHRLRKSQVLPQRNSIFFPIWLKSKIPPENKMLSGKIASLVPKILKLNLEIKIPRRLDVDLQPCFSMPATHNEDSRGKLSQNAGSWPPGAVILSQSLCDSGLSSYFKTHPLPHQGIPIQTYLISAELRRPINQVGKKISK